MAARLGDAYTKAEDALILAAPGSQTEALAERLGRSYYAINSRRARLRRAKAAPKMPLAALQPLVHRPPPPGPNFARPAFFMSENLYKIAHARR